METNQRTLLLGASSILVTQFLWNYSWEENFKWNVISFKTRLIGGTSPVPSSSDSSESSKSTISHSIISSPSSQSRSKSRPVPSQTTTSTNPSLCSLALRPNANKRQDPSDPSPRDLYLSWDDYFMSVAHLSALRSKDPNKQVGACITGPDRVILGIGYNGFPRGCSDHQLPWAKVSADSNPLDTKYPYVCHAEMNAIMNKNAASLKGATMYVTMFPCNNCAKLLIQAGISEVVYYEDKRRTKSGVSGKSLQNQETPTKGGTRPDPAYEASQRLLSHAGVTLRQHMPTTPIYLDFCP